MSSWKTTLGGALGSLGTSLIGVGVIPSLSGVHSSLLTYIALAGFILQGFGQFFAHLFAADSSALKAAISDTATRFFSKPKPKR